MPPTKNAPATAVSTGAETAPLACGIVMPISAIEDCSEEHWTEVREIVSDVISEAGFAPSLVSHSDDVGVIQKRIIQNLYENPIVVCDVSCKNPNVMFELGVRLAFDKPVVIIKDDKTSYSFDTAPIEHVSYPRDLHYPSIVEFKTVLKTKLQATLAASKRADHTTFLKHFGKFTVAKLDTEEVSGEKAILIAIEDLRNQIAAERTSGSKRPIRHDPLPALCLHKATFDDATKVGALISNTYKLHTVSTRRIGEDHFHITWTPVQAVPGKEAARLAQAICPKTAYRSARGAAS